MRENCLHAISVRLGGPQQQTIAGTVAYLRLSFLCFQQGEKEMHPPTLNIPILKKTIRRMAFKFLLLF